MQPKRITVNITSPLYSLKDSAMNVIRNCLPDAESVGELEIPRQLQQELFSLKKTFSNHHIVP